MQNKKIAIGMVTNSYLSLIIFVLEVFSCLSSFPLTYLQSPASSDRTSRPTVALKSIFWCFILVKVFWCHRKCPSTFFTSFVSSHRFNITPYRYLQWYPPHVFLLPSHTLPILPAFIQYLLAASTIASNTSPVSTHNIFLQWHSYLTP